MHGSGINHKFRFDICVNISLFKAQYFYFAESKENKVIADKVAGINDSRCSISNPLTEYTFNLLDLNLNVSK